MELVPLAAELVVTAQLASRSMLSRKLRVRWDQAGYLLEVLETAGVVGPDTGAKSRPVLLPPEELPALLARLQAPAVEDDEALEGEVAEEVAHRPLVVLAKPPAPAPTGGLEDPPGDATDGVVAVRPDDDLELRQAGELEQWDDEPTTLYGRLVEDARDWADWWVADRVVPHWRRLVALLRQIPILIVRLVVGVPRGAVRALWAWRDYLVDQRSLDLLDTLADSGAGSDYEKVTKTRAANLHARLWTHAFLFLAATAIGLAWWAPGAFAIVLAVTVFAAVVAVVPGRGLTELAVAGIGAGAAWRFGADLANLIPHPPTWAWWAAGGVGATTLGWVGRHPDRPLVDLPALETHDGGRPDKPSAEMVIDALCRIGVPGMTLAATDRVHEEIRVRAPGVGRSNRGYTIELELPPGVTASDVMENREALAGALRRKLGCVWPSRGPDHPGHLRIFLSDVPMATAPQPRWALSDGQPIDSFEPFDLVTDQEGEWVKLQPAGTHTVIAGASGFGKSVVLRHLAVALAFDPRARLYVFDGKISGDLDPVRKIAHAYFEGADEEDVAQQLQAFRDLEKEMRRRARFLRDLPAEERSSKVTSALASKYPHLAPIFVLIDECQEYTEYGTKGVKEEMAVRTEFRTIITRISRLGRSAGIHLVLASQKPDAEVLPTAIMGNCSIRLCFKVTEQNHNDQVLGTGAYKAGLKATLFSTDDRGLAWLKAAGDPQVVRGWSEMVDLQTAYDLVEIAYRMRLGRGLLTGQAADDEIEDAVVVADIVNDVEQVLRYHGRDRAQHQEIVEWLRELRPEDYAAVTVDELSARLRARRVRIRQVKVSGINLKGVRATDLRIDAGDVEDETGDTADA